MCLGQEPNIKSHNLQFEHCPGLFLCKGCLWADNWGVVEFINEPSYDKGGNVHVITREADLRIRFFLREIG